MGPYYQNYSKWFKLLSILLLPVAVLTFFPFNETLAIIFDVYILIYLLTFIIESGLLLIHHQPLYEVDNQFFRNYSKWFNVLNFLMLPFAAIELLLFKNFWFNFIIALILFIYLVLYVATLLIESVTHLINR